MSTQTNTPDRTSGHDAPKLVHEGNVASGDKLYSIQAPNGVRYYLAQRNPTTLELWSIEDPDGNSLPTKAAEGTTYMDLPAEVRKTLKLEGYRMKARDCLLAGMGSSDD